MRGFRKLVILGVFLVTLLIVIDIIDAGKKEPKKKELEGKLMNTKEKPKNIKYEKQRKQESLKQERTKRSDKTVNSEDPKQLREDPKYESKKYKVKKAVKYSKEGKSVENNVKPKYTKSYQKVKKYKVFEENEPVQEFKTKGKKPKAYIPKTESLPEKKYQKKISKEKVKIEEVADEELNQVHEENIADEADGSKRKTFKLVEVVLEEDPEEEKEGNDTYIEVGSEEDVFEGTEGVENEEVIEKLRTTQTYKVAKSKKSDKTPSAVDDYQNEESSNEDYNLEETSESGYSEDSYSSTENQQSKYDDPNAQQNCRPLPEDPNRIGPKKLVLYVIEEEVNGQIKKRVVSEEDGVTMCEVADLMKEHYYAGLP